MRSNYIDLLGYFTLKSTYSPVATTWSMSAMQEPLIALVNTLQPRWRDEGLQPKIQRLTPWMRDWEWCGSLDFLYKKPSLKNMWSLTLKGL